MTTDERPATAARESKRRPLTKTKKAIAAVGFGIAVCMIIYAVLEYFTPYTAAAGYYAPVYFLAAGVLLLLVLIGLLLFSARR